MPTSRTANRVVAETFTRGGVSADLIGQAPPSGGFMIGGEVAEVVIDASDFTPATVLDFVSLHLPRLLKPGRYVGTWLNTDTGRVHVDISTWLAERQDAEALGRARGQIAIFDLGRSVEVRL